MDSVRVGCRQPGAETNTGHFLPERLRVHTPRPCFAGSRIQRRALQAAGYISGCMCSPWRTQVRAHGFDRVLSLCRHRGRLFLMPMRSPASDLRYDSKRKSITKMDMKESFGLLDKNIIFRLYVRNDWEVVRRNVVDGKCRDETLPHCPELRHLPTAVVDTDRNKTCEVHGGNVISTHNFGGCLSE